MLVAIIRKSLCRVMHQTLEMAVPRPDQRYPHRGQVLRPSLFYLHNTAYFLNMPILFHFKVFTEGRISLKSPSHSFINLLIACKH